MSKVTLAAKATFDLPVTASRLGGEKVEFVVTFKARTLSEFDELLNPARAEELKAKSDAEMVMDVATEWNLDKPFTAAGITEACNQVPGLGSYIVTAYVREFTRVRLGN